MQRSTKDTVLRWLAGFKPASILDCPSGAGWLAAELDYRPIVDGVDLYESAAEGYRRIMRHDLNRGLPDDAGPYDCIVCCEGLEHLGSPLAFLEAAYDRLNPGGRVIITTPNTYYPMARIQYFLRGFFPGFPCLIGKIEKGRHMHLVPWTFPQLHLFLTLAGFREVELHADDRLSRPQYFFERVLGLPHRLYCANKARIAGDDLTRRYWRECGSDRSMYGRELIVSALR
jgi:SAM-dependent methyltransferase